MLRGWSLRTRAASFSVLCKYGFWENESVCCLQLSHLSTSLVCNVYVLTYLVEALNFAIILFGYWAFGVSQRAPGPHITPQAAELSTLVFWEQLSRTLGSWSCNFPLLLGEGWPSVVLSNRENNRKALPLAFLIAESGLCLSNSNSTDSITEMAIASPALSKRLCCPFIVSPKSSY